MKINRHLLIFGVVKTLIASAQQILDYRIRNMASEYACLGPYARFFFVSFIFRLELHPARVISKRARYVHQYEEESISYRECEREGEQSQQTQNQ